MGKPTEDPSPRQIAARCAVIRRTWDFVTERHRLYGRLPSHRAPGIREISLDRKTRDALIRAGVIDRDTG